MRGEIWLADVLRALEVAETDEARVKAARMLGFAPAAVAEHSAPPPGPSRSADDPFPRPFPDPAAGPGDEPHGTPDTPGEAPESEDVLAGLPLLRPVRGDQGPDEEAARRPPVEPLARPSGEYRPPPYEPLFVPRWTDAVIRALVARPVPEGPVDLDALIDALARCRPVTALPRLPVPTLRHGVQVLVDRGAGMQPFRRDQDELLRRVRAVVGPALVEVGYFSDAPQRGTGPGPRWTRTAYRPPQPGRRVLVLSDLGLGGPPGHQRRGTREEWTDFACLVRRAGCGAVALTPYARDRWANWMPRVLPLVGWDRTTRPGHVGTGRA
ncbi:hypothetical protein [Streptomyces sp. NPDC048659]|uniref:hypothetical protein n=1 Tax=Streptomyces sp. NPDC048659 TaxID=3155489 RepID=UPI0034293EDA